MIHHGQNIHHHRPSSKWPGKDIAVEYRASKWPKHLWEATVPPHRLATWDPARSTVSPDGDQPIQLLLLKTAARYCRQICGMQRYRLTGWLLYFGRASTLPRYDPLLPATAIHYSSAMPPPTSREATVPAGTLRFCRLSWLFQLRPVLQATAPSP